MADEVPRSDPSQDNPDVGDKRLAKDAKERLTDARKMKTEFDLDLREGYWFAAPHRARNILSTTKTTQTKPKDAQELSTSFGFELCGDFPTVMLNTFMPQTAKWAERRPSLMVPPAMRQKAMEQAKQGDEIIFEAIGQSNFYSECGKGFNPDLALGTVAIWIEPTKRGGITCQSIPIRELEINVGPDGNIDDRFVVRYVPRRQIKAILPGVKLPKKIEDKITSKPGADAVVTRGFWRDWNEEDEEAWQYVALIDDIVVDQKIIRGIGCCPLIVGRFDACVEWSWATGPLTKALPDLRTLDELAQKKIKAIDLALNPPIGYPDDSFSHIEDGLEAGMAYPVRPGSEVAIKNIYDPPTQEPAIYMTQDLEQRLKRLFFLDWPQQRGDTPPTATQWLDEMTMAQQRVGTPGMIFWKEFCAGTFQRFEYILMKTGVLKAVEVDGEGDKKQSVSLAPYNPAIKSAEQQEVAQFARFVQIGGAAAPEEFKIHTDGLATLVELAQKMDVTKIWKQRAPATVTAAINQISQLQGGQAPGAPAIPQGAPQSQDPAGPAMNQPQFQLRGQGV